MVTSALPAAALAAQTDVLELMETLKGAGARILPSVWQKETSRYILSSSPSSTTRIAVTTQVRTSAFRLYPVAKLCLLC